VKQPLEGVCSALILMPKCHLEIVTLHSAWEVVFGVSITLLVLLRGTSKPFDVNISLGLLIVGRLLGNLMVPGSFFR
jgi:hypothetical protein